MSRKELRDLIPHGYCKEIARRAGVSSRSVSLFFKGDTNSRRIEIESLKMIKRLKKEREGLIDQIS